MKASLMLPRSQVKLLMVQLKQPARLRIGLSAPQSVRKSQQQLQVKQLKVPKLRRRCSSRL